MDDIWIRFLMLVFLSMIPGTGGVLYSLVDSRIKLTFKIIPPDRLALWRRGGIDLRDVRMNAAGDGCLPPNSASPPGYDFECRIENNTSIYSLAFNSKMEDSGILYILDNTPEKLNFTYQPTTDLGLLTNCKNNTLIMTSYRCQVFCNSLQPLLSGTFQEQNKKEEVNISIDNSSVVRCGGDSVKFFQSDIDLSVNKLKEQVQGLGNVTVKLSIGDNYYLFYAMINDFMTTRELTTITSPPRSSPVSTNQTTSHTSTTQVSQSSSQTSGPHTESSSSSTVTITSSTDTPPSPEFLTSTELIIIIVCSCVGVLILVVVVICCVVLFIRRNKRKRDSLHNNNHSIATFSPYTRNPHHQTTSYPKKKTTSSKEDSRKYIPSDGGPGEAPRSNLPNYKNYGYVMDNPLYTHDDVYTLDRIHEVPRRNNRVKYITYDNVYNHRPSRRDDYRHHTEQPYIRPDRMYYQPYQYYYHH